MAELFAALGSGIDQITNFVLILVGAVAVLAIIVIALQAAAAGDDMDKQQALKKVGKILIVVLVAFCAKYLINWVATLV